MWVCFAAPHPWLPTPVSQLPAMNRRMTSNIWLVLADIQLLLKIVVHGKNDKVAILGSGISEPSPPFRPVCQVKCPARPPDPPVRWEGCSGVYWWWANVEHRISSSADLLDRDRLWALIDVFGTPYCKRPAEHQRSISSTGHLNVLWQEHCIKKCIITFVYRALFDVSRTCVLLSTALVQHLRRK